MPPSTASSPLRQRDRIEPGQEFEIERVGADEYRLVRLAPPPNQGLVDWLLSCPQGYFVPIELNRRNFEPARLELVDPSA